MLWQSYRRRETELQKTEHRVFILISYRVYISVKSQSSINFVSKETKSRHYILQYVIVFHGKIEGKSEDGISD
jgi:hypothetical protein